MLIYLDNGTEFKLERKDGKFSLSKADLESGSYQPVGDYADLAGVLGELAFQALDEQEAVSLRELGSFIRGAVRDMEDAVAVEINN